MDLLFSPVPQLPVTPEDGTMSFSWVSQALSLVFEAAVPHRCQKWSGLDETLGPRLVFLG